MKEKAQPKINIINIDEISIKVSQIDDKPYAVIELKTNKSFKRIFIGR